MIVMPELSMRLDRIARYDRGWPIAVSLLTVFLLVVLIRTAWLSDDAYITLRTVDNFVNGRGLTWNPGVRVQAYTHPLWMFALSILYFVTREAYYTTIVLGMSLSLFTLLLFTFRLAVTLRAVLFGGVALILSSSYITYSTSGLENPLTNLLLVVFFAINLNLAMLN